MHNLSRKIQYNKYKLDNNNDRAYYNIYSKMLRVTSYIATQFYIIMNLIFYRIS